MSDFMNDLRKVYLDFYGSEGPMPDDERLTKILLGDFSESLLSGLTEIEGEDAPAAAKSGEGTEAPLQSSKEETADAEKAGQAQKQGEKQEEKPEKPAIEELNELIGLESIKHDVAELVSLAKIKKLREERGMKAIPVSLHLAFSGNPGTGKTTVARILGRLYKEIGILSKGQLIEVDRSGLVAGYLGQTAIKTQEKIQEALGGILFIDEAYALSQENDSYGQECVDTILKAMEDNRDDFIVIVAGYTEPMKKFIESNPGLKSRFNKYFEFPDYTVDELKDIFALQCRKYQYTLSPEAEEGVFDMITRLEANKGDNFANARSVRNIFESIITNQAARISGLENPTDQDIALILPEDLADIIIPDESADAGDAKEALDGLVENLQKLADYSGAPEKGDNEDYGEV